MLMLVGTLGAMANGASQPVMTLWVYGVSNSRTEHDLHLFAFTLLLLCCNFDMKRLLWYFVCSDVAWFVSSSLALWLCLGFWLLRRWWNGYDVMNGGQYGGLFLSTFMMLVNHTTHTHTHTTHTSIVNLFLSSLVVSR
jgi:hypothetical protein